MNLKIINIKLKLTNMKKVLLLSLSLVLGLGAFAQNRVMKNDAQKSVDNSALCCLWGIS